MCFVISDRGKMDRQKTMLPAGFFTPRQKTMFSFGLQAPRRVTKPGILAQLCVRCGAYSSSNHDLCIRCQERVKKSCPLNRVLGDDTSKNKNTKIRRRQTFAHRHIGNYCTECRTSEKQFNSDLCLICDAKKREKERDSGETNSTPFGNGELIRTMDNVSPELGGEMWKNDWRCMVCFRRVRQENQSMCHSCESKQFQIAKQVDTPVGEFYRTMEQMIKEAATVKEEFVAMTPNPGDLQWDISFQARKESLLQIRQQIEKLRPRHLDEKIKQDEAKDYIDILIKQCQTHFSGKSDGESKVTLAVDTAHQNPDTPTITVDTPMVPETERFVAKNEQ